MDTQGSRTKRPNARTGRFVDVAVEGKSNADNKSTCDLENVQPG